MKTYEVKIAGEKFKIKAHNKLDLYDQIQALEHQKALRDAADGALLNYDYREVPDEKS